MALNYMQPFWLKSYLPDTNVCFILREVIVAYNYN